MEQPVVALLVALFVLSLVALMGWIAYFASDAAFLVRPGALGAVADSGAIGP